MRSFNKSELEVLAQYEDRYRTARDSKFVRNLEPRYLQNIKLIYDEATGQNYPLNATCSHCVLEFMRKVGEKFWKDQAEYLEKAEQMVQVLDEVMNDVPDEKPVEEPKPASKTTGTKKKSTKKTTKK